MNQDSSGIRHDFQSAEFLRLFEAYTAHPDSIGSHLTELAAQQHRHLPLIVATSGDLVLFPGDAREPVIEGFRLNTRGFKELAAVSHLGPAVASLLHIKEQSADPEAWRRELRRLLVAIQEARAANHPALWSERIAVAAYRGRETAIANMIDHACDVTVRYLEHVAQAPQQFTRESLQTDYLEAESGLLGNCVPINKMMIATFFLIGLDTGHRVISWFDKQQIDWASAMVLIVGRQGRPTAGVTWTSNAVCSVILGAARGKLPLARIYIAPHAPPFVVERPLDVGQVAAQEGPMRRLWAYTRAISDLGATMYDGYPCFLAGSQGLPRLTAATTSVDEMPAIEGADDWRAFNTRMRVILEDPRQLLAGCVVDYAVSELLKHENIPERIIVPGLDNTSYPARFA